MILHGFAWGISKNNTGKLLKYTDFKRKKIYGKPKFLKERAVGAFNIYGARQTAKTLNIYGTPTLLIYTEVFLIYGNAKPHRPSSKVVKLLLKQSRHSF